MAAFSYQALDTNGKRAKGVLEGDSERQVRAKLREQGLKPIEVKPVSQRAGQQKNAPVAVSRLRLSMGDLTLLSRQLATLVQSNLPLADALRAVAQQSQKPKVQSMVLQIRSRVLEGHTLAYALAEFPNVFDHLFRSMVAAGEHAGFLGIVLERLADYIETAQATRNKIRMAMLYPAMLVVVAVGVIAGLMTYVVPELVRIFTTAQADLPALTKGLIATSEYMADYGLVTFLALIAAVVGFRKLIAAPARRKRWHRFLLATPGIRGFLRGAETARFASTLSILIASGVPLLDALRIAANVMDNLVLQEATLAVADAVKEGSSLNAAMLHSEQFPPMMVHMIASGEASGELETMLQRSAANQERELDMALGTLMGVLEPLMVIVMGGIVLTIVLAVLMPIFDMNSLVK